MWGNEAITHKAGEVKYEGLSVSRHSCNESRLILAESFCSRNDFGFGGRFRGEAMSPEARKPFVFAITYLGNRDTYVWRQTHFCPILTCAISLQSCLNVPISHWRTSCRRFVVYRFKFYGLTKKSTVYRYRYFPTRVRYHES
jgi:hypothetical protein